MTISYKWSDTSNCSKDINRPLEKGKNKKVIGKFKDELGGMIMSEFCALRAKTYAYRLDNGFEEKKAKGTKKCVIKNSINFNGYVNVLFNNTKLIKSQFGFRSKCDEVYTQKINEIALSSNDDKRIQAIDKITTYSYGYYDTPVMTENNDDTNINTENSDDISAITENIDDIHVNAENIDDTTVNTVNNEGNFEYIEVIDDNNSPYIDFVPHNVVNTEIIDTTSTHANIIDDVVSKYREDIDDTPVITEINDDTTVNNENIDYTELLIEDAQIIKDNSILLRKETYNIRNSSNNVRNELELLRKDAYAIRNYSKVLIEEARGIRNRKELSNFIEKLYEDIKKDSIDLKNSINSSRKEI